MEVVVKYFISALIPLQGHFMDPETRNGLGRQFYAFFSVAALYHFSHAL
jgi:hypothetical protein